MGRWAGIRVALSRGSVALDQCPDCLGIEGHLYHLIYELSESLVTVESALGDCDDRITVLVRHLAHYHSKCSFPFPFRGRKTEE